MHLLNKRLGPSLSQAYSLKGCEISRKKAAIFYLRTLYLFFAMLFIGLFWEKTTQSPPKIFIFLIFCGFLFLIYKRYRRAYLIIKNEKGEKTRIIKGPDNQIIAPFEAKKKIGNL